jgi:hypothetical protein
VVPLELPLAPLLLLPEVDPLVPLFVTLFVFVPVEPVP